MLYSEFPQTLNQVVKKLGVMLVGNTGNHWYLVADIRGLKKRDIPSILQGHVLTLLLRNNSPFDLLSVWTLWTKTEEYRTIVNTLEEQCALHGIE